MRYTEPDARRLDKKFYLETFGCQMNVHDSEKVIGTLISEGYRQVPPSRKPDLVLYNTCSIRDKAEQKVFHRLNDYKKFQKQGKSLGCWGAWRSRKAKRFSSALRMSRWSAARRRIGTCLQMLVQIEAGNRHVTGLDDRQTDECFETEFTSRTNPHRGYITIIEGCDKFCAYCVVPFTRGKERSRTSDSVLAEARQMADLGYTEIQLLGQNVNSYKDPAGKKTFAELLAAVGEVPGIEAGALYDLSSPRFRARHCRCDRRRSHSLRSRASAGAERLYPRARCHAAALHPRAVPGTHLMDEVGQARDQPHQRHHRRFPGRDRG